MRKPILYISSLIVLSVLSACTPQRQIAGNYQHKTECLGLEGDGSQTLLAWGAGRNRFDAVEQAKKNAVKDVLLKGIIDGKGACDKRPLISEVNAEEKYEEFFVNFFQDKGPYLSFVSMKDERIDDKITRDREGARKDVTNSVVVIVHRYELKKYLTEQGILK